MKSFSISEKLLIKEVMNSAKNTKQATRGLFIGALIKLIRTQLGMSQNTLAKRAGVPQSMISRIEREKGNPSVTTLQKILDTISCDFIIVPILRESIDSIRYKQAKKIAQKHLKYLKGTMNLEKQQIDSQFTEELLKEEINRLLQDSNRKLWEQ